MSLGPHAVTADRLQHVDFTQIFHPARLSAIMSRDPSSSSYQAAAAAVIGPSLVVRPFSAPLWVAVVAVLPVVVGLFYVIERIYSDQAPVPRSTSSRGLGEDDDDDLEAPGPRRGATRTRHRAFGSSLWSTVSTILLRSTSGSGFLPDNAAIRRVVVAAVWFFSLCLVTSYTANMAAILATARRPSGPTPADVFRDRRSRVVTVSGGDVSALSRDLLAVVGEDRWSYVNSTDEFLGNLAARPSSDDDEQQSDRVREIFVHDRAAIEYRLQNDMASVRPSVDLFPVCDDEDGDDVTTAGYAIAMPKRFAYTDAFNLALSRLKDDGTLRTLRHR